jgi:hypothetical protein
MTYKVYTKYGDLDRDLLEVTDIVTETEGARNIECSWKLKETGEEVRRDGFVNILRAHTLGSEQGSI